MSYCVYVVLGTVKLEYVYCSLWRHSSRYSRRHWNLLSMQLIYFILFFKIFACSHPACWFCLHVSALQPTFSFNKPTSLTLSQAQNRIWFFVVRHWICTIDSKQISFFERKNYNWSPWSFVSFSPSGRAFCIDECYFRKMSTVNSIISAN